MNIKQLGVAVFIVITLVALIWVTINVANLILWKPPIETKYVPIVISYPDSMFMPFYGEDAPICTVKFLLEYNGTLSENTLVKITNSSCWSYVPYNITVYVGIPQAIKYSDMDTIGDNTTRSVTWGGTDILIFRDSYTPIVGNPFEPIVNYHVIYPSLEEEIYFPVAGDYSPIILIGKQGEELNPIIYRYDQIRVHVTTATEVEGLNLGKVNLGFSVVFSWIGYAVLVYELIIKVFKKKEESQIVININVTPDPKDMIPINRTKESTKRSVSLTLEPNNKSDNEAEKNNNTNNKPNKNNTSPK